MIMTKYDCSRTLDYVHEATRLCTVYTKSKCEGCPLGDTVDCAFVGDITPEHIDILQRWSDEHPEKPKLTKKEHNFLSTFPYVKGMSVNRTEKGLYFVIHRFIDDEPYTLHIDDNMFPFVGEGEEWDFDKLLSLEVEE